MGGFQVTWAALSQWEVFWSLRCSEEAILRSVLIIYATFLFASCLTCDVSSVFALSVTRLMRPKLNLSLLVNLLLDIVT